MIERIPEELKYQNQWVAWRYEDRGGKPTKVPISTLTGRPASSTNPADWSSYEDALKAYSIDANRLDGIGFVFTEGDPYVGIDLDDCLDGDAVKPWALEILETLAETYAEISPSGNGIKIFAASRDQPKRGRKAKVEDGAIEIYSRGRFFTVTGEVYDSSPVTDKTDEINAILDRYIGKEKKRPSVVSYDPIPEDRKVERARAYLATMDPSVSGDDGHGKAFRAACLLVNDFDLDPGVALSMLAQDFNPRCLPPWSDRELRHKVDQAAKQPGPKGSKLAEDLESDLPTIDLTTFRVNMRKTLDEMAREELDAIERSNCAGPMPKICRRPPGLISEIIDYTDSQSFYPQPLLSLAGAISLMATITGRKIEDRFRTRTNLYVLALAPTGAGKDQSRTTNQDILETVAADSLLGGERIASHAGLISHVAKNPVALFQLDEMGDLLSSMKSDKAPAYLKNIGAVLKTMSTSSRKTWRSDVYADTEKTKTIKQPHVTVYGSTTPNGFWSNLTADNIADGLLGRMIPIEVERTDINDDFQNFPPPCHLIASVKWWMELNAPEGLGAVSNAKEVKIPDPIVAAHSDAAYARHWAHLVGISKKMKGEKEDRAAIWARTGERTSKLALIFAASRCTWKSEITIETEDVERAIALSNWVARLVAHKAELFVSSNVTEERFKRAWRVIEKAGKIDKSTFGRETQFLSKKERSDIVDDLVDQHLITVEVEATKGAPKTIYRAR